MMKRYLLTAIFALCALLPMVADDVTYLTTEEFKTRVFDYTTEKKWKYKGNQPCVIDFYTTWCGPCKRLAPIMEELSQTYCDQVKFYKVDTERERELAGVFRINSIPQVLYVPAEGEPVLLKGLYPREDIIEIISDYLLKKGKK